MTRASTFYLISLQSFIQDSNQTWWDDLWKICCCDHQLLTLKEVNLIKLFQHPEQNEIKLTVSFHLAFEMKVAIFRMDHLKCCCQTCTKAITWISRLRYVCLGLT